MHSARCSRFLERVFRMDSLLFPSIFVGFLVLWFGWGRIKTAKQKAKIAEVISRGRHATGLIGAVKSSAQSRSEQVGDTSDTRLFVRLTYRHPNTGESTTSVHTVPLSTPNLPTSITTTGSVVTDLELLGKRFAEMKAYRHELESQGLSKDEADKAMMDFTLQKTHEATVGEEDEHGYLTLTEPVEVDVYLHQSAPSKDGVHIVFRKSQELALSH